MIKINNLNMAYKDNKVLENINIQLEKGKIYGLLGKNGVGKTTLLKILADQIVTYSGEILSDGENIRENEKYKENTILISEKLLPSSTSDQKIKIIFDILRKILPFWDENRKNELMKIFKLNEKMYYHKLSTGNKNIINLIIGLCSNVDFLMLDEPSTGLDAINRDKFYKILMEIKEENNSTVIISTHIIDEIENVLEEVIILDDKNILLQDSIENIQRKSIVLTGDEKVLEDTEKSKNVISKDKIGNIAIISLYDELNLEEIENLKNSGVKFSSNSLQKLFISLIDKGEI